MTRFSHRPASQRPARGLGARLWVKILFTLAAVLCSASTAWAAKPLPLSDIQAYLDTLTTLEARVLQFNADGSTASGTLYIRRPGRMRFEYDPPNKSLVIAGGGQVAIFDGKSNQAPTQYPLSKTPLRLILLNDTDLSADSNISKHYERDGTTHIVMRDAQRPEAGEIRLVFTQDPISLLGWVITDDLGNQTGVRLEAVKTSTSIPPSYFSIPLEKAKRSQ